MAGSTVTEQPPSVQVTQPGGMAVMPISPANEDELLLDAEKSWYQRQQQRTVPYKGIVLAFVLLTFGISFIVFGSLLFAGIIRFQRLYSITPYGLIIFGILCIIPGAYHIYLAIRVGAGNRGYSWDDFFG